MGSDPPHHQPVLSDSISDSPEPITEDDISRMRSLVVDMGLGLDNRSQKDSAVEDLTSRERELGGMVIRLLDSFVDPTQLHRQAEFIQWLGSQRDLLVQSFEEERRRWEVEREGWTRMAEALLSQRARAASSSHRDEELERQCAAYESENKSLREKLQDSHSRFSTLEAELSKLKPLLLMQPSLPFSTSSSSFQRHSVSQVHLADPGSSRARRRATDSAIIEEPDQSSSGPIPVTRTSTPQANTYSQSDSNHIQPRSGHYRQHSRSSFLSPLPSRISSHSTPNRSIFSTAQTPSVHAHPSKKSRSKHKKFLSSSLPPLTADARMEHLLLAARKIGRERANAVSGLMRHVEKEKEDLMREREAERLDREHQDKTAANTGGSAYYRKDLADLSMSPGSSATLAMPKTPRRGTTGGHQTAHFLTPTLMTPRSDLHIPTSQTPNSFVFVRTPATSAYQTSMTSTPRPTNHPPMAAQSTEKPARTPSAPSTSTSHQTPLASLLSAAKSMMDDESNEPSTTSNNRRRTGVLEPPESPLPKRRKVGNGNTNDVRGPVDMLAATSTPGSDRVRSALDVLADQAAAAFDSDWQSPSKSPTKPASKSRGQDKGKRSARTRARAAASEEEMEVDMTPKGKEKNPQDSHSHVSMGSPLPTRGRSKGLLTDRLPKESTKTSSRRKTEKSVDLPQRSIPAPRMIFSPGARSPIPPLPLSPVPALSPTPPTISEQKTNFGPPSRLTLVDDDDHPSVNGATSQTFKSPAPSSKENNYRAMSDSPSVSLEDYARVSQRDAITPSPTPQDTRQAEDNVPEVNHSTMTSVAEISEEHDLRGETSFVRVPDRKEGTGDMSEGVEAEFHASRIFVPDEDGHDTDADAEGEMDVDAEETVFIDSSPMTHDPLSLALPQSQLGSAHAITVMAANSEQNSGRP
ncbi:hypothetical protein D9756_000120 [Leucocoprinus leucothites]|uniref:Uncharacterized protein n=1 Tax=Leucocoprinus leucothites TaxID=201217 RepID=A0A8H5GG37_9AGAR|nr:hypothetical protein D9756_000120 [Leucoagaricus leucothites]